MKKSTHTLFLEVVKENSIDLNSPYKLERTLCINKICDKIDWSEYNAFRAERKVRVIEKFVNMIFNQTNSRRNEMLTNIEGGLDPELPF